MEKVVLKASDLSQIQGDIEWEVKGVYYVADCWVTGDELEVWFDVNANWVMTENELDNVTSVRDNELYLKAL